MGHGIQLEGDQHVVAGDQFFERLDVSVVPHFVHLVKCGGHLLGRLLIPRRPALRRGHRGGHPQRSCHAEKQDTDFHTFRHEDTSFCSVVDEHGLPSDGSISGPKPHASLLFHPTDKPGGPGELRGGLALLNHRRGLSRFPSSRFSQVAILRLSAAAGGSLPAAAYKLRKTGEDRPGSGRAIW